MGKRSSDAAATLRVLNELWQIGLSGTELVQIGARIGSDVPLFFALPVAGVAGRGEQVERIALNWSGWVLLVFGGWSVPTPEVYRVWQPDDSSEAKTDDRALLQAADAGAVMAAAGNDLEPAVFRICPQVRELQERVAALIDRPVRVSGAGSTVFTVFDDQVTACAAAQKLTRTGLSAVAVGGGRNALINV